MLEPRFNTCERSHRHQKNSRLKDFNVHKNKGYFSVFLDTPRMRHPSAVSGKWRIVYQKKHIKKSLRTSFYLLSNEFGRQIGGTTHHIMKDLVNEAVVSYTIL